MADPNTAPPFPQPADKSVESQPTEPYTSLPVPQHADTKPMESQPAEPHPSLPVPHPAEAKPADAQRANDQPTGAARRPTTPRGRGSGVPPGYDLLLYFVALFVPPIPVLIKRGFGGQFVLNIILWIFGWIPGVIHAWYIIAKSQGVV